LGDAITIVMRDGIDWHVDRVSNTDIIHVAFRFSIVDEAVSG